jgi:hypothetical protein
MGQLLDAKRSVVVVIDLQGKLVTMVHRPRLVLDATKRLLRVAGIFGVPVMLTEQYPEGLGPTAAEVRELFDGLAVPKRTVSKTSFGCCGEPSFLRALGDMLTSACSRPCSSCWHAASRSSCAGSASPGAAKSTGVTPSSACSRPARD